MGRSIDRGSDRVDQARQAPHQLVHVRTALGEDGAACGIVAAASWQTGQAYLVDHREHLFAKHSGGGPGIGGIGGGGVHSRLALAGRIRGGP